MPLTLKKNTAIPAAATATMTSTVGEPSVGNTGSEIFFTGNWYAALSTNDGSTWAAVDPFSALPPVNGGFCCDQTVIFDPSRKIFIWLLQYILKDGTNTLRMAVRNPGTTSWHWWDLHPTTLNAAWTNQWFDYNSCALSNNFLYVTSNVFSVAGAWQRAVVIRLKLDLLKSGGALSLNFFSTTSNGSLRCTLGAKTVMYFGSHNSQSQIRVFTWPENTTSVTQTSVNVTAWNGGSYSAPTPGGGEWMSRTDGRITAAWLANGVIGFAWTANKQTGRPFPFIRAVQLNEVSKTVQAQPDLWNAGYAYAYPDVCPNDSGLPGVSAFRGGGTLFPSHLVGVLNGTAWSLAQTAAGTNAPGDTKWGDYLTCRRHDPDGATWIATGYTLQGGSARTNIVPRCVQFSFA
jgi:hypothetical protein